MTGRIRTTTVFDALTAMDTLLKSLTYPVSTDTDQVPKVFFLGDFDEQEREYVWLMGKVPGAEVAYAGAGPNANKETYDLEIQIGTNVAGSTGAVALARLEALTNVVEVALRDQTTGQIIPLVFDGAIELGGIRSVEVNAYPSADEGWAATTTVIYRVHAYI
jgi:hypothetical protein